MIRNSVQVRGLTDQPPVHDLDPSVLEFIVKGRTLEGNPGLNISPRFYAGKDDLRALARYMFIPFSPSAIAK